MSKTRLAKQITYQEALDIIALYANDLLGIFADHWNRWPTGNNAYYIVKELCIKQASFESIDSDFCNEAADKINQVVCEILRNRY